MKIVEIKSKTISGLSVRTKNSNEMAEATAKIGGLWGQFYSSVASNMKSDAAIYGVYYNYESDFQGEFNVLAGTDSVADITQPTLESVSIPAGKYAVFTSTGDMPKAVIDAWSEIWSYFSASNSPHQRAYTTDFESYKGSNEVDVYIAIK